MRFLFINSETGTATRNLLERIKQKRKGLKELKMANDDT